MFEQLFSDQTSLAFHIYYPDQSQSETGKLDWNIPDSDGLDPNP